MDNLLTAWREFLPGKRNRKDVEQFSIHLIDNILLLHHELTNKTYRHGSYIPFRINDPKPRDIHKATVRDRLLHHAIYRILYPYFDNKFIFDSYSCRRLKGTHRAVNRLREYAYKVSLSHKRTVWILKCDIRKFFANIDHAILEDILKQKVDDEEIINLIGIIIASFHTKDKPAVGLPLGNLTSQLLVNIYMNEFDHFVKRNLKISYYIRYADDFVILHENKDYLKNILQKISIFLETQLKLSLHPEKVFIQTLSSGVDFLGWVNFPTHRVLRTSTKHRMLRKLNQNPKNETTASYLGILKHGNTYNLTKQVSEIANEGLRDVHKKFHNKDK